MKFLHNEGEPWIKKIKQQFQRYKESYNRAESCELIDIFMLSLIGNKYNSNNIGLCRYDRLSV